MRSFALAASLLLLTAACHDPGRPSVTAPESAELASSSSRKPPVKPATLRVTGNTSYSVSFAWDAAAGAASYRLRDNWAREISVPGTQTSVTWKYPHPPLNPGGTYSFSMQAVDAAGNRSASSNSVSVSLPLDKTAPTVPAFTVTSVGTKHISLAWSSIDDSPWISYIVMKDGVKVHTGWISATSRTFTLLQPGTTYTFTAQARDYFENVDGGNVSAFSAPFTVTTKVNDGSDVTAPTEPAAVWAEPNGGGTELQVMWAASTDDVTPQKVILYEIYVNGMHENSVIGTTQAVAYGVFGDNVVTVIAIDEAGNRSTAGRTTVFIW